MRKIIAIVLALLLLAVPLPIFGVSDAESQNVGGILKYSTVTDWSRLLTRLHMVELAAGFYETLAGEEIDVSSAEGFSDCDSIAAKKMKSVGIVNGYADDTLRPERSVTQAEAATLYRNIIESLGYSTVVYEDEVEIPGDVEPEDWYYQSVLWLCRELNYQIIKFFPNHNISAETSLNWATDLYSSFVDKAVGEPDTPSWLDEGVHVEPAMENGVFLIHRAEELAWIALKSRTGTTFNGKIVRLMADIDLSGREWQPIGDEGSYFQGIFDGAGHKIVGLQVGSREWPAGDGAAFICPDSGAAGIVRNTVFYSGEVYKTGNEGLVRHNRAENCVSNVLLFSSGRLMDGLFTQYSLSPSQMAANSYERYEGEHQGATGKAVISGVGRTLSDEEMQSEAFLGELNSNANELWASWVRGEDGYPVLDTVYPNPEKYWIASASEAIVDAEDVNTYFIYTPEQLAWISQEVNFGNSFKDKTVRLMNDIDLGGKYWTPIGGWNGVSVNESYCFEGNFDGNSKIIDNLKIGDELMESPPYEYVGLFGRATKATIKNVTLKNVSIFTENRFMGGLAGTFDGALSGCVVKGVLHGLGGYAGGLIGSNYNAGRGSITECGAEVELFGEGTYVGGLIASAYGSTIERSYSTGNISVASADTIGGLVGSTSSIIEDSYSSCNIQVKTIARTNQIGGLTSVCMDTINNCVFLEI